MHHPVTSSTAAQAIATVPKRLPKHVPLRQECGPEPGKAVMLMADPMNRAKLVKATLSSDRRGYKIECQKRGQNKRGGNADMTGQNGGMALLFQFPGLMPSPTRNMKMTTPT